MHSTSQGTCKKSMADRPTNQPTRFLRQMDGLQWIKKVLNLFSINRDALCFIGSKESCMQKIKVQTQEMRKPFEQFSRQTDRHFVAYRGAVSLYLLGLKLRSLIIKQKDQKILTDRPTKKTNTSTHKGVTLPKLANKEGRVQSR